MTGKRISPDIEKDIRLKQAWACAKLNNCEECQHVKVCVALDDKAVAKMHEPVRRASK